MAIIPELDHLELLYEEAEAVLAGKVCVHLPGPVNRFCSVCGALIVAHELVVCGRGHAQMVTAGTAWPIALWCTECQAFRDFAA